MAREAEISERVCALSMFWRSPELLRARWLASASRYKSLSLLAGITRASIVKFTINRDVDLGSKRGRRRCGLFGDGGADGLWLD
jgi:hypothetical protein